MKTLTLIAMTSLLAPGTTFAAGALHSPRGLANLPRTAPYVTVDKLNRSPVFVHRGDSVFNPTVARPADKRDEVCAKSRVVASPRAFATFPHLANSMVTCTR